MVNLFERRDEQLLIVIVTVGYNIYLIMKEIESKLTHQTVHTHKKDLERNVRSREIGMFLEYTTSTILTTQIISCNYC